VHVSELADDFYTFDNVRLRFVGKRRRKIYQIGDHIEVEVAEVDTFKRQVDFRIVDDPDASLPAPPAAARGGRNGDVFVARGAESAKLHRRAGRKKAR
jgi:transcriptional accessory protein Tex/SPT6